ncbi:MAG TPA: APC family permease [Kofleriaceae bacterium]|nr:APC family permease [Kofleriaceae bacterium]
MATSTTAADSFGRLRRILGVGFGLAVNIGSMIGVGILRASGQVAGQLHTVAVILTVWALGGLYTLVGASCLTELGALLPQAGGYYVYSRRAFGDWIGFAVGWTDWIMYCLVLGYVSIGMSEILAELVPEAAGAKRAIAIAILVGFVGLQWAGVRISSWFQEWTTALKFLAFLALVVAALAVSGLGGTAAPTGPAEPLTLPGLVAALQVVTITYAGWQSALYFTEEDRDPVKNLPRAMIGGVIAVAVIYLLVNFAMVSIVPIPELARATVPAAEAASRIADARGGQVLTALALITLPPLLNAIMMIGTRILFALGRDGLLWPRLAAVNARGTPGAATLATTVVSVILILAFGDFTQLVAITSVYLALNYAVACLALVVLRRREPSLPRPVRAWGYPWSAAVVIAGAVAFLVGVVIADARSAVIALGLLAFGLLLHANLPRRWRVPVPAAPTVPAARVVDRGDG